MWTKPMESKCPKCGKIHKYQELVSFNSFSDMEYIQSIIDKYQVTCECGESFDASKTKTSIGFGI